MVDRLKKFIEVAKQRLQINYDFVVAIAGIDPGVGKTALAIQIGMGIDDNFTLRNNIAYIPQMEHIEKQFMGFPKYSCFLIDEAIKVLYKLNWMDKLQQSLNELYDLERKRNICTILCIPRFIDLNEHFRHYRVKVWIQILSRGQAIVYIRDPDEHCIDPWHIKESYELKKKLWYDARKKIADIDINERIEVAKKLNNYLTHFEFGPLSPRLENQYLDILDEKKQEYLKLKEEQTKVKENTKIGPRELRRREMYKSFVLNMHRKGWTVKQMKEMLGEAVHMTEIYTILKNANLAPNIDLDADPAAKVRNRNLALKRKKIGEEESQKEPEKEETQENPKILKNLNEEETI